MALTDSLISVWELSEASGNALDSYGSNDLTDNNTVGAAAGKIIGARDFESGNSESFSIADNSDLSTGDIDFTFACWFRSESQVGQMASKGSSAGGTLEWRVDWNGAQPRFLVSQSGGFGTFNAATWSSNLSNATWYWLCGGHRAASNVIWITINNGTEVTTSYSSGSTNRAGDFRLGLEDAYWDGLQEQACFWKRYVDSTDRATIYNAGAGLDDWWAGGGGGSVARNLIRSQAIARASRW